MDIYGVLLNGAHIDVSLTEKGAKNFATRNGYDILTIRYKNGYISEQIAQKKGSKWTKIKSANKVYNKN